MRLAVLIIVFPILAWLLWRSLLNAYIKGVADALEHHVHGRPSYFNGLVFDVEFTGPVNPPEGFSWASNSYELPTDDRCF